MATQTAAAASVEVVDLAVTPVRALNQRLHDLSRGEPGPRSWRALNPNGAHAVACGVDADVVRSGLTSGLTAAPMPASASAAMTTSASFFCISPPGGMERGW